MKKEPKGTGKLSKENVEQHISHIDRIVEGLVEKDGLFATEEVWNLRDPGLVGLWTNTRKVLAEKVTAYLERQKAGKKNGTLGNDYAVVSPGGMAETKVELARARRYTVSLPMYPRVRLR